MNLEAFETERVLAISTGHIRKSTQDWIVQQLGLCYPHGEPPVLVGTPANDGGNGWFVHITTSENARDYGAHLPGELAHILRIAKVHGFTWLRFDCDRKCVPHFPEFDYEHDN